MLKFTLKFRSNCVTLEIRRLVYSLPALEMEHRGASHPDKEASAPPGLDWGQCCSYAPGELSRGQRQTKWEDTKLIDPTLKCKAEK